MFYLDGKYLTTHDLDCKAAVGGGSCDVSNPAIELDILRETLDVHFGTFHSCLDS
jgi:hypothetical protein